MNLKIDLKRIFLILEKLKEDRKSYYQIHQINLDGIIIKISIPEILDSNHKQKCIFNEKLNTTFSFGFLIDMEEVVAGGIRSN